MKIKKRYWLLLFFACIVVGIVVLTTRKTHNPAFTTTQNASPDGGKILFYRHCTGCHMAPAPERLPKEIWKNRVLPVMAIKMGLEDEVFERLLSDEELKIEKENRLVPDHPMITKDDLQKISNYIVANAPDSLPYAAGRLNRSRPLFQFTRQNLAVDDNGPSLITALQYDKRTKSLWLGNLYNQVQNWKWNKGVLTALPVQSPVVNFSFYGGDVFFTGIGDILPSELSRGSISFASGTREIPVLTRLHRPVHTEVEDLNGDNIPEMLVCNFGKNGGSLSLFRKNTSEGPFIEQKLISLPGATKTVISDMDGDGKKDIVALIAQADETVYIFYNKGNLSFEKKAVLRFPPDYGTTDIVLFDYNKDGALDILTAHGDNADYSIVLKPFHGIRLHVNDGKGSFVEKFFFPMYGATKVVAEDFDQDGDMDIAATAFYPDYGALLFESFIYLENNNSEAFHFQSYTSKTDLPVKSLTLEKGDIDDDGDVDILLGSFAFSPVQAPGELQRKWKDARYGIVLFKNNLR